MHLSFIATAILFAVAGSCAEFTASELDAYNFVQHEAEEPYSTVYWTSTGSAITKTIAHHTILNTESDTVFSSASATSDEIIFVFPTSETTTSHSSPSATSSSSRATTTHPTISTPSSSFSLVSPPTTRSSASTPNPTTTTISSTLFSTSTSTTSLTTSAISSSTRSAVSVSELVTVRTATPSLSTKILATSPSLSPTSLISSASLSSSPFATVTSASRGSSITVPDTLLTAWTTIATTTCSGTKSIPVSSSFERSAGTSSTQVRDFISSHSSVGGSTSSPGETATVPLPLTTTSVIAVVTPHSAEATSSSLPITLPLNSFSNVESSSSPHSIITIVESSRGQRGSTTILQNTSPATIASTSLGPSSSSTQVFPPDAGKNGNTTVSLPPPKDTGSSTSSTVQSVPIISDASSEPTTASSSITQGSIVPDIPAESHTPPLNNLPGQPTSVSVYPGAPGPTSSGSNSIPPIAISNSGDRNCFNVFQLSLVILALSL